MRTLEPASLTKGANSGLTQLAENTDARITMIAKDLRSLMLYTGGRELICGQSRNIRSRSLGAGVYEVWTEARR